MANLPTSENCGRGVGGWEREEEVMANFLPSFGKHWSRVRNFFCFLRFFDGSRCIDMTDWHFSFSFVGLVGVALGKGGGKEGLFLPWSVCRGFFVPPLFLPQEEGGGGGQGCQVSGKEIAQFRPSG